MIEQTYTDDADGSTLRVTLDEGHDRTFFASMEGGDACRVDLSRYQVEALRNTLNVILEKMPVPPADIYSNAPGITAPRVGDVVKDRRLRVWAENGNGYWHTTHKELAKVTGTPTAELIEKYGPLKLESVKFAG